MSIYNDILCIIPAKAASTRLKKKNILKLNGKEMMGYAIEAAHASNIFGEDVYVSTESLEVAEVADRFLAKVPYIRDEKLAKDPAGVVDVVLDFFEKQSKFKTFKTIVIILPTSPLINSEDILQAYDQYTKSDNKFLMSVTYTEHNAHRAVLVKNGEISPLFPSQMTKRSQELEATYNTNAAITIMDVRSFLKSKSYFTYPLEAYIMPRERAVDIDTMDDFRYAEYLLQSR